MSVSQYQKQHDVSDRKGQAVGIDPLTGRVWFGESIVDINDQLEAEGIVTPPLLCSRRLRLLLSKGRSQVISGTVSGDGEPIVMLPVVGALMLLGKRRATVPRSGRNPARTQMMLHSGAINAGARC